MRIISRKKQTESRNLTRDINSYQREQKGILCRQVQGSLPLSQDAQQTDGGPHSQLLVLCGPQQCMPRH